MADNKKKWIQKAIKRPGALTEQAKKAGMTIEQFCSREDLSPLAQKRCNLWRTLRKLAKNRKQGS